VPRLLRNVKSQGRTSSHTSDPHKSYGSGEGTVTSDADTEHLTCYRFMRHVLEKFTFVLKHLHVLKCGIFYRLIISVTTRTTGSRVHSNLTYFWKIFITVELKFWIYSFLSAYEVHNISEVGLSSVFTVKGETEEPNVVWPLERGGFKACVVSYQSWTRVKVQNVNDDYDHTIVRIL